MALSTIQLTGKYQTTAGTAATGSVSFELSGTLMDGAGNVLYPSLKRVVTLDGQGAFSIALPATKGDSTTSPTGLVYVVREAISPNVDNTYQIELDTANGEEQDLSDIAPVTSRTITYGLLPARNLSDVLDAATARENIGAASAVDLTDHTDATTSVHGIVDTSDLVLASNNLNDVTAATARTNLGVNAAADLASTGDSAKGAALVGYIHAGTGAVASTVYAKLNQTLDARDFGVIADGSTDNSSALATALNAASAADAALALPPGTIIGKLVSIPGGMQIVGQGQRATILKLPASANAHLMTIASGAAGVHIRDLTIDGNASNQSVSDCRGIYTLGAVTDLSIEHVTVTNTKGAGIVSSSGVTASRNVRISHCNVTDIGAQAIWVNAPHTDVRIDNCYISNWGAITAANDAINLTATNASDLTRLSITDNTFVASASTKFAIESVTPSIASLVVADNIFDGDNCGLSCCAQPAVICGNSFRDGIGTPRSGMELSVSDAIISGNQIANGQIVIAGSSGFSFAPSNVTISSNVIKNLAVNGIGIVLGGDMAIGPVSIQDNLVDMSGASSSYKGLLLGLLGSNRAVLTKVAIRDNTILGGNTASGSGIQLTGATGSSGIIVAQNRVAGFALGVLIQGSPAAHDEVTIDGNDLRGCPSPYTNSDTGGGYFRVYGNIHADASPARGISTTNDAAWFEGENTELITLSTSGTTTDSSASLLPANALILSVVARITATIATATNWKLGDSSQAGRFCSAQNSLATGTTVVGLNQWDPTNASSGLGPMQTSASKLRVTTTGTPSAGAIRVTVFYRQFRVPQN